MAADKNSTFTARLRFAWRALVGETSAATVASGPAARVSAPVHPLAGIFDAVIGGMPSPAVLLDHDGRVLSFNAAAATVASSLRKGEPVLLSFRMPELVDAVRRAGKRREPQRVEFFERVPVDRWFEAFVTPLKLPPAAPAQAELLLMTFNDLTPLRRVEQMRADFVANASHELRTPLAALVGFIETLQGPAKSDAAAREKFLAIMQQQATRMARLIDDLLSLSRIELNAHLQPDTAVELQSIVRQVVDGLMTLAQDREVAINVNVPPEPLIVLAERDELMRALENLIENALKYGSSGKRVDVTLVRTNTRSGAGEARLTVRDFGPGIAPEHLPRLTERFYRVDVADSRSQGGTGLGLALVKHVLARHGGRLSIESTLGQGASFTMSLPLPTGSAAPVQGTPVSSTA
jgi:two-component system, OmpR family, phosphate regulon sensor histidine kinase PhoR